VKLVESAWHFDLTAITVSDYRRLTSMNLADQQAYAEGVKVLCRIVTATPLLGDFSQADFYDNLDVYRDWIPMQRALFQAMTEAVKNLAG
jgi:hypothetical protein